MSFTLVRLMASPIAELPIDQVFNPRVHGGHWVTGQAQVLSPNVARQLNQKITDSGNQTTAEIAVVTIPKADQSVRSFAIALFNR